MVTLTIVVTPAACYVDYRVERDDKLEFVGDGIRIYMRKSHSKVTYNKPRKESVRYLALLAAQEHHIPLITLRYARSDNDKRSKKKIDSKQMKLL